MGFLMRNFLVRVLLILTVTVAGVAHAQLRVVITEGQVAPTPIAIADFTGPDGEVTEIGRQMSEIISNDLESSGLFQPIDSAAFISPPKPEPELPTCLARRRLWTARPTGRWLDHGAVLSRSPLMAAHDSTAPAGPTRARTQPNANHPTHAVAHDSW